MIPIEDIKNAVNAKEIIGRYVDLKKQGREWVGLCPFHHDSSPSLFVNDQKNLFLCRACGTGGDVVEFIRKIENLGFVDAAKRLAVIAGVDVVDDSKINVPQLKLADAERVAFERWMYLRKQKLIHRLDAIGQTEGMVMAFMEVFWNQESYLIPQKAIDGCHRKLNMAHEARELVSDCLLKMDAEPESFLSSFMDEFYGDRELHDILS